MSAERIESEVLRPDFLQLIIPAAQELGLDPDIARQAAYDAETLHRVPSGMAESEVRRLLAHDPATRWSAKRFARASLLVSLYRDRLSVSEEQVPDDEQEPMELTAESPVVPVIELVPEPVGDELRDEEVLPKTTKRRPRSLGAKVLTTIVEEDISPDEDDPDGDFEQQLVKTNLTNDNVRDYLREIGKTPLLNAEQEVELSKKIEAGLTAQHMLDGNSDKIAMGPISPNPTDVELERLVEEGHAAMQHMVQANLRLVVGHASKYLGRGLEFMDLISEGNLGIIRAVEKFDYTKGFKFSTYATWWIKQALPRALANQGRVIRYPVHMHEQVQQTRSAFNRLSQDLGRDPSVAEIAEEIGIPESKAVGLLELSRPVKSLDAALTDGKGDPGDTAFGDIYASEPDFSGKLVNEIVESDNVRSLLEGLDMRAADIISRRLGLYDGRPQTLDEIGQVWGVTRERIRQLESKAMNILRKSMTESGYRPDFS